MTITSALSSLIVEHHWAAIAILGVTFAITFLSGVRVIEWCMARHDRPATKTRTHITRA